MILGSNRSQNLLGNRRPSELFPPFVSMMVLLATMKIWRKEVAATPSRRTTTIKVERETTIVASSRSKNDHCWGKRSITWSRRERGRRHTSHDSKSRRENGSEARDMVTTEKRTPNLRRD